MKLYSEGPPKANFTTLCGRFQDQKEFSGALGAVVAEAQEAEVTCAVRHLTLLPDDHR